MRGQALLDPEYEARLAKEQQDKMAGLKEGDAFPDGVDFMYVPYSPETESPTACGIPIPYKASEEWKDKKVVFFAVPGAFTPGCSARHLPPYIENQSALHEKGIDIIAVLASNDPFVMSAWAKVNGVKNNESEILFLSDPDCKFTKSIGWDMGVSPNRSARWAMVLDKGKVTYAEKEPGREVGVSGVEAVMAKL